MAPKTTYPQARMVKSPPFSREVENVAPIEGESIPRRNSRYSELLTTPEAGISTLFDIVKRGGSKFGNLNALGSRKLIKKHNETKKIKKVIDGKVHEVDKDWTYFELSPFEYTSFAQLQLITAQLGAGLRKLGLVQYDKIHMFASTSAHWLLMAHGAFTQSMSIVTAYDTLGEEGLRHSLTATKAKAIFLEPHLLKTFQSTLKDAKDIRYIIYNTQSEYDINEAELKGLRTAFLDKRLLSFDDLRTLGEKSPYPAVPPSPEDLCCIMYTSGSTGAPKGVEITHSNVVAAVAGANSIYGGLMGPSDSLLAYLPLAHIMELVFENCCLYWGSTLGYGSIRTLSQTNCRNCKGDIQEFKPTLLIGIPAVWETVKKGILTNLEKSSNIVQAMFWSAMVAKRFMLQWGLPGTFVLDALVFKRIKEATGGRLRAVMNGAAPLADDTQDFISLAISPVVLGYGMSETAAMAALGDPFSYTADTRGEPPASVEVKLVDFPEAGYFVTNKPNQQGEIWIRGAPVMARYFESPELTDEAIAPGGWFKTGDIGEWDSNGHLKVIDRKKNLVKTLNGEYIALEKLESVYRSAKIVLNICVYASITETKPIAIIVANEPVLTKLADTLCVDGFGVADFTHNRTIQAEVLKQLQAVGKKAGLANIEMLQGVVISEEEWTPQSGLLTATNKLNRKLLTQKYQKEIDAAYGKN